LKAANNIVEFSHGFFTHEKFLRGDNSVWRQECRWSVEKSDITQFNNVYCNQRGAGLFRNEEQIENNAPMHLARGRWVADDDVGQCSDHHRRASVIDGDTIKIGGQRIRLHAINARESSQTCLDAGGRSYRCGQRASFAVADQIGQRNVSCRQTDTDRYRRVIAVCDLMGVDLNGWMVRQGRAIAYRRYGQDHGRDEDRARRERRRMWSGRFAAPWDRRRGNREHTRGPR
jgi:endonuclease YncB( thermonuclease family)